MGSIPLGPNEERGDHYLMHDLQDFATRAAAVSEGDQVIAGVVSMADQVAAYYARLVKSDVPEALAHQLTLQAASFVWNGPACCHGAEE